MRTSTKAMAWVTATAAAAAISWAGVNLVLREAVFGPPDTVFLPAPANSRPEPGVLPPVSTQPPAAGPVTAPSQKAPASAGRSAAPSASAPGSPTPAAPSAPATGAGDGRSYTVRGGQVALSLGPDSATLLSATPGPGWAVKTWRTDTWLRVDFTKDGRTSSVFVTWNGHPPVVDTYEQ
ncbi:hypothetical protein ACFV1L_19415 [Kitasatospora sp. NPDC059646]|uniref:hypothetical protein n=1 Tax=Kitasatospora sp. NPDC059646 TaxID=3346893 RepID=UPI0036C4066A